MNERQRRDAGLWYDANYDESLVKERLDAEELTFELNRTAPQDVERRNALLKQLLGSLGEHIEILTPFSWIMAITFLLAIGRSSIMERI